MAKLGWKEISHPLMAQSNSKIYENSNGLKIRFDIGQKGKKGYGGIDHYHIYNPASTGKHDYYLDINGNPVPKNSKASHIIPKEK